MCVVSNTGQERTGQDSVCLYLLLARDMCVCVVVGMALLPGQSIAYEWRISLVALAGRLA